MQYSRITILAFLALMAASSKAQTLYDLRWSSEGIDYAGFMIYFNEDDIYMRVGYSYDGGYNLTHTEYHYDLDSQKEGIVIMEGLESQYIREETDSGYEPFHIFWAVDDDNVWLGPLALDNYHLREDNFDDIVEVTMTEIHTSRLTEEYLQWFYVPEDEDYYILVEAKNNALAQVPTAVPTEAPTLHLIMIANTLIPDIGPSTRLDSHNASNEFEGIANVLAMNFNKVEIADKDFTKERVAATLASFQPSNNDVVVLMYSGHGFRFADQAEKFPQLDFRYNDYQPFGAETCMNLKEISDAIVQKGARLNLIIGDCCNTDIGIPKQVGSSFLASRSSVNASIPKLQKLFIQSSGTIVAAGASQGESSWGSNNNGGFFTNSLIGSLREEVSILRTDDEPRWEDVLDQAVKGTQKKSQMCQECKPQNPIFEEFIANN
ncbi:MAG: caspase family protein [Saprospiraceae bacterium]|nr:caspase family protein [Saprospiraceae bacterium]